MREYIDYIGDKEQYSLSDYLYSESEAFYMDAPRDTGDVTFLELITKFQEDTPYHAGIATWEKIIAFAFAKNLSVDDANDILQEYHFTALYPKSLLESSIIYALNTGMGAKAWIGLYKKYQKMMKSESQENKSAVFGKRLEKREFYSFLAESKSVADLDSRTKMVAEMRAVDWRDLYDKCQNILKKGMRKNFSTDSEFKTFFNERNERAKKVAKDISKAWLDLYKKYHDVPEIESKENFQTEFESVTSLNAEEKGAVEIIVEAWLDLYNEYKSIPERELQSKSLAYLDKRLKKSKFFSCFTESETIEDLKVKAKNTAEMIAKTDVAKDVENSLIKVLNDYYNGKLTISKVANLIKKEINLQSKDIFYHMAKNANFNSREDVEVLYSKLKKTSSSLLTLDIVQKEVEGIEPYCAYKKLKLYFDDNFSLDALYDMLKLFSNPSPYNDDTFGITLDNTNQEITQWLTEATAKQNYSFFFEKAKLSFESVRYKKRRCIFKYLYFLIQNNIERFVDFEKEYILNNNYSDELNAEYLRLSRNTLLKGLPTMCLNGALRLNSLSKGRILEFDTLSQMDITFSSLFFDFCLFWGNYNLIGKAFVNKFGVSIYKREASIEDAEDGYEVITVTKGNQDIRIGFDIDLFKDEYQLFDKTEEDIKEIFINKLSENIKGWPDISLNNIEWLLNLINSREETLIDELLSEITVSEYDAKFISEGKKENKEKQMYDKYLHDYKIFKDIITGKTDASRDFLLMFAVYCGADLDEIEDHLLVNVGYDDLDEERPFDRLIIALAQEIDIETRRNRFFEIVESLDLAYESDEIGLYYLQNEILNAMCSETHTLNLKT